METAFHVLGEIWSVLGQMAPYLLFGFLVAGMLSVLLPTGMVKRHLAGDGPAPVVKASFFGVPLPLCSCGVIPVAMGLRKSGASRGATVAFLISTPQTGADSIAITYALLGPVFAVFRPVAAFVMGVAGGLLADRFTEEEAENQDEPPSATDVEREKPTRSALYRILHHGFVTLPADIAGSLLIGIVLAGLFGALVPKDILAGTLGQGFLPLVVMMAAGIPLYICSAASVPFAWALLQTGVSPGAVLVFLVTGPATNAATVTTIARGLGRRALAAYLGAIAAGALLSGVLLNRVLDATGGEAMLHSHELLPGWVESLSAVALLAVLLLTTIAPRSRKAGKEKDASCSDACCSTSENSSETVTLRVDGMTCNHCAQNVKASLEALPGVSAAQVDLSQKNAIVKGVGLDRDALTRAIAAVGYDAE